jgi:type II secretory pathway pseudopilin PulG
MEPRRWKLDDADPFPATLATAMNSLPAMLRGKSTGGHTLVEVMVAVGVLALMVVLIFQVIEEVLTATRTQNQGIEAVSSARRLLDVMTIDLQNAVIGGDATVVAPSLGGTNLFALISNRRGAASTNATRFLAVSYSLNDSNQVIRSYGSVGFARTNLLSAALNASTNASIPLASGVLGIQVRALTDSADYPLSGSVSPNWAVTGKYRGHPVPPGYNAIVTRASGFSAGLTNCTRAIEVTVAIADEATCGILKSSGNLGTVTSALSGDSSGWRGAVDVLDLPGCHKSAIRIIEKTIPLP